MIIGHLDMDAFFAAVEEREKPWLKGFPVVVGADPDGGFGRGVVSTANYLARTYGIRSALPISKAWQYSEGARRKGNPGAIFITPRSGKYGKASKEVTDVVLEFVPTIQKTSVDEMYLDLTFTGSYKKAEALAKMLRSAIKKRTRLTGSIGIGPNKMIAKIASDFKKPDGLTVVSEERVVDFIAPLSVRVIPGIGPKMEEKLLRMHVKIVAELQAVSKKELVERFGSWGTLLFERGRGCASTKLTEPQVAKSIGEHHTFSKDTHEMRQVLEHLSKMTGRIFEALKRDKFIGFRTVVLTVRFSDFETKQRSVTTKTSMQTTQELELKAMKLLLPFFEKKENPHNKAVRMVGLRVEKLQI